MPVAPERTAGLKGKDSRDYNSDLDRHHPKNCSMAIRLRDTAPIVKGLLKLNQSEFENLKVGTRIHVHNFP